VGNTGNLRERTGLRKPIPGKIVPRQGRGLHHRFPRGDKFRGYCGGGFPPASNKCKKEKKRDNSEKGSFHCYIYRKKKRKEE
jgi:hypothetical protein